MKRSVPRVVVPSGRNQGWTTHSGLGRRQAERVVWTEEQALVEHDECLATVLGGGRAVSEASRSRPANAQVRWEQLAVEILRVELPASCVHGVS